jgi:hypothetical protein
VSACWQSRYVIFHRRWFFFVQSSYLRRFRIKEPAAMRLPVSHISRELRVKRFDEQDNSRSIYIGGVENEWIPRHRPLSREFKRRRAIRAGPVNLVVSPINDLADSKAQNLLTSEISH